MKVGVGKSAGLVPKKIRHVNGRWVTHWIKSTPTHADPALRRYIQTISPVSARKFPPAITDMYQAAHHIHRVFGPHVTFADIENSHGVEARISRIAAVKSGALKITLQFPGLGYATRTYARHSTEGLVASHDQIDLKPGTGAGPQILKATFKSYERLGVKRVDLTAGWEVGRYFWAKLGFQLSPHNDSGIREIRRNFHEWATHYGYDGPTPKFKTLQEMADFEHKGRRWGKEYMTAPDPDSFSRLYASQKDVEAVRPLREKHGKFYFGMPQWEGYLNIRRGDANYERARRILGM